MSDWAANHIANAINNYKESRPFVSLTTECYVRQSRASLSGTYELKSALYCPDILLISFPNFGYRTNKKPTCCFKIGGLFVLISEYHIHLSN